MQKKEEKRREERAHLEIGGGRVLRTHVDFEPGVEQHVADARQILLVLLRVRLAPARPTTCEEQMSTDYTTARVHSQDIHIRFGRSTSLQLQLHLHLCSAVLLSMCFFRKKLDDDYADIVYCTIGHRAYNNRQQSETTTIETRRDETRREAQLVKSSSATSLSLIVSYKSCTNSSDKRRDRVDPITTKAYYRIQ